MEWNKKNIVIVSLLIVFLLVGRLYIRFMQQPTIVLQASEFHAQIPPEQKTSLLQVFVTGEVSSPGLYTLPEYSRVVDAVNAAGGMTEHALLDSINLAAFLEDAQHIVILPKEEIPPKP